MRQCLYRLKEIEEERSMRKGIRNKQLIAVVGTTARSVYRPKTLIVDFATKGR